MKPDTVKTIKRLMRQSAAYKGHFHRVKRMLDEIMSGKLVPIEGWKSDKKTWKYL